MKVTDKMANAANKAVDVIADYIKKNTSGTTSNKNITPVVKKVVGTIAVTNLADTTLKDLGVTKIVSGFGKAAKFSDSLLDMTIGKIPGLNFFWNMLKGVRDWTNTTMGNIFIPNITKEFNDSYNNPNFYTHLSTDSTGFEIPANYDNAAISDRTTHGSVEAYAGTPSVVTYSMIFNMGSDLNALQSRVSDIFTLCKAVRGLSNVSYTKAYIMAYIQLECWLEIWFVKMRKVISGCVATSSIKSNMPHSYLKQMGFSQSEVAERIADYQAFLSSASARVANLGLVDLCLHKDKIDSTLYMLKDSSLKCSTLYNCDYPLMYPAQGSIIDDTYFDWFDSNEDPVTQLTKYWSLFKENISTGFVPSGISVTTREFQESDSITHIIQWNYDKMVNYFEAIMNVLTEDVNFMNLRSDMIGAFGASNFYKPKTDYFNILSSAKYDLLGLYTLKNASTFVAMRPLFKYSPQGSTTSYTAETSVRTSVIHYINGMANVDTRYDAAAHTEGSLVGSTSVSFPCTQVSLEQTKSLSVDKHAIGTLQFDNENATNILTIHKDRLVGGEAYELLTKKYKPSASYMYYCVWSSTSFTSVYLWTKVIPVLDVIVNITNDRAINSDVHTDLMPQFYALSEVSDGSNVQRLGAFLQVWGYCDYQPYVRYQYRDSVLGPCLGVLWDIDNPGAISDYALNKAVTDITYSLNYPNIHVTTERGKQIESIANFYTR